MIDETSGYSPVTDELKAQIKARYYEISATYRAAAAEDGHAAQTAYETAYWAMAQEFNIAPADLNWITAMA